VKKAADVIVVIQQAEEALGLGARQPEIGQRYGAPEFSSQRTIFFNGFGQGHQGSVFFALSCGAAAAGFFLVAAAGFKYSQLLGNVVLNNLKVLRAEPGHLNALFVGHRNVHLHHYHIHANHGGVQ
jgi:hypothetical protein